MTKDSVQGPDLNGRPRRGDQIGANIGDDRDDEDPAVALAALESKWASEQGRRPAVALALERAYRLTGETNKALAVLTEARARWPKHVNCTRRLAAMRFQRREFAECANLLRPLLSDVDMPHSEVAVLFARSCFYGMMSDDLAEHLPALRRGWPRRDDAAILWLAITAVTDALDIPENVNALLSAPLSEEAVAQARVLVRMLEGRGHFDDAARLLASLAEVDPNSAPLRGLQAKLDLRMGRSEKALATFSDLAASGDLEVDVALVQAGALASLDRNHLARTAYMDAVERAGAKGIKEKAQLEFAEFLASVDDPEEAFRQLANIDLDSVDRATRVRIEFLRTSLGEVQEPAADASYSGVPLPDEVLEDGKVAHYRFGEGRCVLWFSGVVPQNLAQVQQYYLPIWRELEVSVLTVVDVKRLGSLAGFGRHFPDRAAAARALSNLLAERGYGRFATSGTSLSGFSAVLYGYQMGAAGTLSFSGPSYLPAPEKLLDPRGLVSLERLLRVARPDVTDLRTLLDACPNFILHQHYGIASQFDADQAEHLKSLPNVHLFGASHDRHNSLKWLHNHGLLRASVAAFMDETGL